MFNFFIENVIYILFIDFLLLRLAFATAIVYFIYRTTRTGPTLSIKV